MGDLGSGSADTEVAPGPARGKVGQDDQPESDVLQDRIRGSPLQVHLGHPSPGQKYVLTQSVCITHTEA